MNFNSHAHVERDHAAQASMPKVGISTHTLTWSVTLVAVVCGDVAVISTHTLTWSVTIRPRGKLFTGKFQLTRSRGA